MMIMIIIRLELKYQRKTKKEGVWGKISFSRTMTRVIISIPYLS